MDNLLSGFLGVILGSLLSIGYVHVAEKAKLRVQFTLEIIDYLDEIYNGIMTLAHQPAHGSNAPALLSAEQYIGTVRELILLLNSTKPQTRLDILFPNDKVIDVFERLREAFKIALNSCRDQRALMVILNESVDPLYKEIHTKLVKSTRL